MKKRTKSIHCLLIFLTQQKKYIIKFKLLLVHFLSFYLLSLPLLFLNKPKNQAKKAMKTNKRSALLKLRNNKETYLTSTHC